MSAAPELYRVVQSQPSHDHYDVIVIGAGQAGLSVGYHLKRKGLRFLILDGNERVGDSWRKRWDSLRLFTPARFDALVGMPFPAPADYFPTRDEMADYLESYARKFALPVQVASRVESLTRRGAGYVVKVNGRELGADQVVVAMASYQSPKIPALSSAIDPQIVQLHSTAYKNPAQLPPGPVLIVGAGNSGAEIGIELAKQGRKVWMSGRDTGAAPFKMSSFWGRLLAPLLLRVLFHYLLTIKTPMGRKARPKMLHRGGPLIRTRQRDLAAQGVERVGRVVGANSGLPLLDDGSVLEVASVIWCTGFHPGFSWIDLGIFDELGDPRHEGGVVGSEPGLYFVGLHFLYSFSSTMIHGVARDAKRIVETLVQRKARAGAEPRL
jgi:putative flavoprotein involved in K+ transport